MTTKIFAVFVLLLWAIIVAAVTASTALPADKVTKQASKTVVADSTKIAVVDSLLIIRHDTVKVTNTFKDTSKLVKSDTAHGLRYDTLRIKRK
jgi:hypothetical protein